MTTDVFGLATGGILELVGLLAIVVGVMFLALMRGKGTVPGVLGVLVGFGLLIGGVFVGAAAVSNSTTPPAPPQASVLVQLASAPALASGETWSSITNTLTVDLVYNATGHYFAVKSSVGFTSASPKYVMFPLKLVRSDAINATYSFPLSITGIPTAASLGATPTVYSVVGYSAATSTTPGQWQVYFDKGTLASQTPTVSAPSVSTNVLTDPVPVNSFGSVSPICHVTLAGSNSTSAPTTFAEALQNFTSYPMTFSVGQGTPASLTISYILLGWGS